MKKNLLIYLLVLIGLSSCTDDDTETARITISAKDIATNSYIKGGIYRVLNINKEVVGTYSLENGSITITNLAGNDYMIEEVTPPDGYVNQDKTKEYKYSGSESKEFVFLYINTQTRALPQSIKLKFKSIDHGLYLGDYNGIRIGEYYWTDQNFTCVIPWGGEFENSHPITQKLLNRYVERVKIDTMQYQLENISDFEKSYGRYYSYPSILYMNKYGSMLDEYGQKIEGWKLPSMEDYRQLFAMSPFNSTADPSHTSLNERDVRFALGAKKGDNKMAFDIQNPGGGPYKTYWFDTKYATNMYKFNLMPGGARLNGPGGWCNGLGPDGGCYSDGVRGDIYHLFYTAYMAVQRPNDELWVGVAKIHDKLDTREILSYHLLNVRWCRRLTDTELGYKLYINNEQTDIKKLDLETPTPEGYKELPHGYIRGFYIQYILNNPDPKLTINDIVKYAKSVQDSYVTENRGKESIIL